MNIILNTKNKNEVRIMNKPIRSFAWQILNIDDIVVYLKDGCKFIGQITGLDTKAKIQELRAEIEGGWIKSDEEIWDEYLKRDEI